ncbi:MAG: transposase zinc-binding domain-containing protein [Chthoniobacterales bacterium]
MALCCRESRRHDDARPQLAEVLRAALPPYAVHHSLPAHHWKTLNALRRCHTAELGGHLYRCVDCGREHFVAQEREPGSARESCKTHCHGA